MTDNHTSDRRLKLRALLEEYSMVIVGVCVLVVLLGGWLAYGGLVDTGEARETEEIGSLEYSSSFDYSATVEDGGGVYEEGTELRGLPEYPTSVAPTVDVTYRLEEAGNIEEVNMDVSVYLVIEETLDGQQLWEQREQIEEQSVSGSSGTIQIDFSQDIPQLEEDINTIETNLGTTIGEIDTYIEAQYTIVGTVGDRAETATGTTVLDISPGGTSYSLETSNTDQQQPIIESQTVEQPPDFVQGGIGISLILSGLVLSGVLLAASKQSVSDLTTHERSWLEYSKDREEFDEWITTISLPDRARNLPQAEADTLADLVDFAIDSGNSVIEDPTDGTYYVVHDGTRYEFEPPRPPDQEISLDDYLGAVSEAIIPTSETTDEEQDES